MILLNAVWFANLIHQDNTVKIFVVVFSEYGIQQAEKQKLKLIYGLREKQFKKYFDIASKKSGVTPQIMMELLERRLDNVVFRLGLAPTRRASRQLVGHGHIMINSKKVSSPSYSVSPGELVDIKESSKAKKTFSETRTVLKNLIHHDG